jgi:arabinan endo-1,5-alpha-L-arabinosidase
VVQLDATTGKPAKGAPIVNIASRDNPGDNKAIEGSFMVRNGTDYWLFVSWNTCCRGAASNYEVRVGKGPSVTGPFVDQAGTPMLQGGGTHLVGYPAANGWAAGGGQSLLRSSPGMPLPGGAGATFPRQTMVLHAYDAQSGDPWLQVIQVDWTGAWPAVVTA